MNDARFQFQQSLGRANDEKIAAENSAKDKLQELQEKYAETVKSPLEAIGGGLTEDAVHDTLIKAAKFGFKKLGATDEQVETVSKVLTKLNPKNLLNKPKQAVLDTLKGKAKAPVKSVENMGDEMDGFASKVKSSIKVKGKAKAKVQEPEPEPEPEPDANPFSINNLVPLDDAEATATDISKTTSILSRTQEAARTLTTAPENLLGGMAGDSTVARTLGLANKINPNTVTSSIKSEAEDGTNLVRQATTNVSEKLGAGVSENLSKDAVQAAAGAAKQTAEDAAKAAASAARKALLKKAGAKVLETEGEGGGPEDPFADLFSLIIGGATLLGGIFSHKKKQADAPQGYANPTMQQGVGDS